VVVAIDLDSALLQGEGAVFDELALRLDFRNRSEYVRALIDESKAANGLTNEGSQRSLIGLQKAMWAGPGSQPSPSIHEPKSITESDISPTWRSPPLFFA
jgi:hypothetical protein